MKKIITLFLFISGLLTAQSQDVKYAHYVIDSLCSPFLYGRAYTNNGANNAAIFISNEFDAMKMRKFSDYYFQNYPISINSFSKNIDLEISKKNLVAGTDFMVALSSPSVNATYKIFKLDSSTVKTKADLEKLIKKNLKSKVLLVDKQNIKDKEVLDILNSLRNKNVFNSAGYVFINDGKLSWGTSDGKNVNKSFRINVLRKALPEKFKKVKINIEADYLIDYPSKNVVAYVKGKLHPDSFFVFTAHYDHLGQMGKDVFFPGANDNASGTAMVLDLAKYYSDINNQPDYSIVFALVCGEESGLNGSQYLAENPLFPLDKVKFLINIDMVGTGSEGITIVNGTKFETQFKKFEAINKEKGYLKTVSQRGESCNSDHCPFYQKGVPAVFIYAMGSEFTEYHNIYDVPQKLPLTKYNEIFKLLTDFIKD